MNVLVLGLGSVLMGDDAFGPSVAVALQAAFEFAPGVAVLDGGTPGLNLMAQVIDYDALIVVDTVKAKGYPGDLRFYRKSDLSPANRSPRQGPHEPGLDEVLTALDLAGRGPSEVLLIGVIPQSVKAGIGMSETLRSSMPAAARAVLDELQRLGRPARVKPHTAPAIAWWESGACCA